jgi:hypothetical protein
MRFMLMLKSDESTPAGPPPPALFAAIGAFGQEAVADGSLVDQGGLLPSATGALVSLVNGSITATDGPFAESKELVGGYAVFDVRSREEAVQKARRFLQIHADNWPGFEGICEVRQIADGGPEG